MKESRHSNSRELSEQQQLLLMSLHDGECGVFSRWRANRLVSQSPKAAEFIATLDAISEGIDSSVAGEVPQLAGSLWEGISRRIEQEERAALFLGERRVRSAEPRVNRRILAPLGWSVAGGLVAASFTVLFLGDIQPSDRLPQNGAGEKLAHQRAADSFKLSSQANDLPRIIEPDHGAITGASLASSNSFARGNRSGAGHQQRVDVDWVQSDGSVRFFSDPSQRSTMIWVKKRSPAVRFYTPPTPLSRTSFDGAPQLIEKPVPESFAVSNR